MLHEKFDSWMEDGSLSLSKELGAHIEERVRDIWMAFRLGAESMRRKTCTIASQFSVKPDRSLLPDIPWEEMNVATKTAAHSTAQQIALEISFLDIGELPYPESVLNEDLLKENAKLRLQVQSLREVLDTARNGIIWYAENVKEANESDAEMLQTIDSVLRDTA